MASKTFKVFTLTVYLLVVVVNGTPAAVNNNYKDFVAVAKIEAEDYSDAYSYISSYCDGASGRVSYVEGMTTSSYLEYAAVDFGAGVQTFTIRLSNSYGKGPTPIDLHLGDPTNPTFGTILVSYTVDGCDGFQTFVGYLDVVPTGVQDLYLTFPSTIQYGLALDYFYFNQTTTGNVI